MNESNEIIYIPVYEVSIYKYVPRLTDEEFTSSDHNNFYIGKKKYPRETKTTFRSEYLLDCLEWVYAKVKQLIQKTERDLEYYKSDLREIQNSIDIVKN